MSGKLAEIVLKFKLDLSTVLCQKDADSMANSVDLYQPTRSGALLPEEQPDLSEN